MFVNLAALSAGEGGNSVPWIFSSVGPVVFSSLVVNSLHGDGQWVGSKIEMRFDWLEKFE